MGSAVDPKAIAIRIRAILASDDREIIEALCGRLNVSEAALRLTIDEDEPHPVVDVIAAVAQHYGVDPVWLLVGEYDATAHRVTIGDDHQKARINLAETIARHLSALPDPKSQRGLEA